MNRETLGSTLARVVTEAFGGDMGMEQAWEFQAGESASTKALGLDHARRLGNSKDRSVADAE